MSVEECVTNTAERAVETEILSGLGYAALMAPRRDEEYQGMGFSPNLAYERYLRMHKVLVGRQGADQLESVYVSLKDERLPRYLTAAGSAAVEAALIRTDAPTRKRMDLLERGVECWRTSLSTQKELNAHAPEWWVDNAGPFRSALDIATSPLLKGIILGYVTRNVYREVFEDTLRVAQANAVRINLMSLEGDDQGKRDHLGFGYECNALLGFNRRFAPTRFAIPSMTRSDNGHHHRQQTHDLLIVEQKRGEILQLTPAEVKSSASKRDKERYKALLVRGKMHLSIAGRIDPIDTLSAITASYEGTASKDEKEVAESVTTRLMSMYRDYCAGENLADIATNRSVTVFHDNARVVANHPGLMTSVV